MNAETITLQDCIENYEYKDTSVIINDGKITGFSKENRTQATDQSAQVLSTHKSCYFYTF